MNMFNVQGIHLQTTEQQAFSYIADPSHLPQWTHAFASANNDKAVLRTPTGEIEIGLDVKASLEQGTIDWLMKFPDGSVAAAYSRVVALDSKSCVYTFVLTPPPLPLEQLEGALEAQASTLSKELQNLKELLEQHD